MGEYEDRYPDAYGRDDAPAQPPREEVIRPAARPSLRDSDVAPTAPLSDVRSPSAWEHAPARATETPAAPGSLPPRRLSGTYRGVGPRGYTRSPQRIFEDICDRLTENPFIDASDIEVQVSGLEVTLSGAVDSAIALRQAEEIADEVVGVSHVHNRLTVRPTRADEPTPGDQVNRAMGSPRER